MDVNTKFASFDHRGPAFNRAAFCRFLCRRSAWTAAFEREMERLAAWVFSDPRKTRPSSS